MERLEESNWSAGRRRRACPGRRGAGARRATRSTRATGKPSDETRRRRRSRYKSYGQFHRKHSRTNAARAKVLLWRKIGASYPSSPSDSLYLSLDLQEWNKEIRRGQKQGVVCLVAGRSPLVVSPRFTVVALAPLECAQGGRTWSRMTSRPVHWRCRSWRASTTQNISVRAGES